MKIWKLKDFERHFVFMIREQVPIVQGTREFWDGVATKILRNSHLTEEEFAALYYATVLMYNAYQQNEPKILLTTYADAADKSVDLDGRFKSQTYVDMIQNLYITLAMEKPNGREFCSGSLKFTDEEYEERRKLIESELTAMQPVAERYVENLDKFEVQVVQRRR